MTSVGQVSKTCPSCGAEFSCGATDSEPCWCNALPPLKTVTPDHDCLCPACLKKKIQEQSQSDARPSPNSRSFTDLIEGEDFYREDDRIVFTALYHLRRGYCCGNGCRHCPY